MKIYVLLHFYSINIKINKLIGEKKKKIKNKYIFIIQLFYNRVKGI